MSVIIIGISSFRRLTQFLCFWHKMFRELSNKVKNDGIGVLENEQRTPEETCAHVESQSQNTLRFHQLHGVLENGPFASVMFQNSPFSGIFQPAMWLMKPEGDGCFLNSSEKMGSKGLPEWNTGHHPFADWMCPKMGIPGYPISSINLDRL